MDNRNDLQWRPEDWQHTLGHLRRAERLLAFKTWGLGTAVVGAVATGTALYMQPEAPAEDVTVATVEQVEAVNKTEETKTPTWDEAMRPQGEQEVDGFETTQREASLVSGSTRPVREEIEAESSMFRPEESRQDGADESPSQGLGQVERTITQAQTAPREEAAPPADLRLLKLRNGLLLSESLDATLLGQPPT